MTPIASPLIPDMWPCAYGQLRLSIDHGGEHTERSVFQALMNGQMILWANDRGYVVTTWCDYPAGRIGFVLFIGGSSVEEWIMDIEKSCTKWAKTIGCKSLRVSGRKGWMRLLKGHDYSVTVSKRID